MGSIETQLCRSDDGALGVQSITDKGIATAGGVHCTAPEDAARKAALTERNVNEIAAIYGITLGNNYALRPG